MQELINNYNRKKKFLSFNEVENNKEEILNFFPFIDENNFDCVDYYSNKKRSENYCGLEYMEENNCYDLFSWSATKIEKELISKFQKFCKQKFNFIPIANNF